MQPLYWLLLAQGIEVNDPTHQVMTWTGFVIGIATALLIVGGALLVVYRRFILPNLKDLKPLLADLSGSTRALADKPTPGVSELSNATALEVAKIFAPITAFFQQAINQITNEKDAVVADRDTLKTRLLAMEATINTLTTARSAADGQIQELKTQIDAQCVLLDKQTQQLDALRQSLTQKDTDLEAKNRTIAELTIKVQRITELEQRVQKLETEVAELKMDKAELEKQLETLKAELETAKQERDAALARAKQAEAERDAFALRVQNQQTVIGDLTKPLTTPPPTPAPTPGVTP